MKLKLITVASLVAFSAMASAQSSVTATYGVKEANVTSVQSHVTNMSVKTRAFTNVDLDAGINTETADVARTVTNRYEIGVSTGMDLTSFLPTRPANSALVRIWHLEGLLHNQNFWLQEQQTPHQVAC